MEISIIVPVYNAEPYIRRCVDSILDQTFADFELILIDDGSPDSCGTVCEEYSKQDTRVRVIHQNNGGVSAARNAGIDWAFINSNSEWLMFVDSDDWIHPQMLESLRKATQKTQQSIGIVAYEKVAAENIGVTFSCDYPPLELWSTERFFCEKNVDATVPWGKLYRKDLFQNFRYPIGKIHEDEFLTYKIIFQTEQIVYIPQPMYWYFQNTSGITHAKWNINRLDKVQAFREQLDYFEKNGYTHAYRTRINSYAWIIGEYIHELSESDISKKRKYIRQLRNTLRAFIREKKDILSPVDTSTKWIFQIAYPIEMKVCRFFRNKAHSLRKLGLKGIIRRLNRK